MMGEIEQSESGDEGRAREWMSRALRAARDPAWTADGIVADRWAPTSPVTGALDAFQWRVPVETMEKEGHVLTGKLEELLALGLPREIAETSAGEPAKAAPVVPSREGAERAQTIEVVPAEAAPRSPEAETVGDEPRVAAEARPRTTIPEPPAAAAPAARQGAEAAVPAPVPKRRTAAKPAAETRRKGEGESRVFEAPRAPDDPGPDTGEQDDVGLPLRPQRA
jgi:HemY protein